MSVIEINVEGLRTNISSLNARISELEELNSRLDALISRIDSSWEGQSCDAYVAMMRSRLQKSRSMISVLTTFRSYAESTVARFERLDQSGANRIRGC